jgi:hypothetical protein
LFDVEVKCWWLPLRSIGKVRLARCGASVNSVTRTSTFAMQFRCHYVLTSSTPCTEQTITRCRSVRILLPTSRYAIKPVKPFTVPSKLEQSAWHDAVNARILHSHTRNLCRRLLDCPLGPCYSFVRAFHIRLGPRRCCKSCQRLRFAICFLPRASLACRAHCGARNRLGQLECFCEHWRW